MKKDKFFIGAIVGAAAGLVAGILTAPKSGKQTRTDLKNKATELKNDAQDTVGDTVEQYKAKVERAVDDLKDSLKK